MIESVGTLYAIQDLFVHLEDHQVQREDFLQGFDKYGSSTAQDVYDTATRMSWICTADNGQLVPTALGKTAHQGKDRAARLRYQLANIIESQRPPWAALLPKGRKEAAVSLPPEISQCFEEALLFEEVSEDLVQWWDRLAGIMREYSQRKLTETGRAGERLTLRYETDRTKKTPKWQAIETNYAGYDVLSVVGKTDHSALRIEVKASERAFKNAVIHITEHEWITAMHSTDAYHFHVWLLDPTPTLFVIPSTDVLAHIPKNQGKGKWRNCCISLGALSHPSKGIGIAA